LLGRIAGSDVARQLVDRAPIAPPRRHRAQGGGDVDAPYVGLRLRRRRPGPQRQRSAVVQRGEQQLGQRALDRLEVDQDRPRVGLADPLPAQRPVLGVVGQHEQADRRRLEGVASHLDDEVARRARLLW